MKSDPHTFFGHVRKNLLIFIFYLDFRVNLNMHLLLSSLIVNYVNGLLSRELVSGKKRFVKIYCALCLLFRFFLHLGRHVFIHVGVNGSLAVMICKMCPEDKISLGKNLVSPLVKFGI